MKWFKKIVVSILCMGSTVTGICVSLAHNSGLISISLGLLMITILMIVSDDDK